MSTLDLKVTRNRLKKNWRVEFVNQKFSACSHKRNLRLTKWRSQHCVSRRSFPGFVASLLPSSPIALLQVYITFHIDFHCLCQLLIFCNRFPDYTGLVVRLPRKMNRSRLWIFKSLGQQLRVLLLEGRITKFSFFEIALF